LSEEVLQILVNVANKPEMIRGIRNMVALAKVAGLLQNGLSFRARARDLIEPAYRFCSILPKETENAKAFKELRFFDDARGSAVEYATCLDVSVAKRITKSDRIRSGSLRARDFKHDHVHERERGIRFATAFN
jgi:hypothetical protein